jgi:hypothetical protein
MTEFTTHSILRDAYSRLRDQGVGDPTVERVVHGENMVYLEYPGAAGSVRPGVAHSPGGPFPSIEGRPASEVLEVALATERTPATRALAVATLNALSRGHIDWQSGDPMEGLDVDIDRIAMVGMFKPAFKKFEDVDIRVVERFPEDVCPPADLPSGVTVDMYGPEAAETAFADTAVVYITGSTFVYGGIGEYLAVVPPQATVVVIGSTSSFVPGPLFEAGADVVAGATVDDAAAVRHGVEDGASVPHLHRNGLEKGLVRAARV